MHRVVFPGGEEERGEIIAMPRYSIAYFCHPMDEALLEAVPSERVRAFVPRDVQGVEAETNPYAQRKVLTAGDHLLMRLKESYGALFREEAEA